ncbi:MAG: squalene/phytoene synthase family protein [Alphaproteobacteria bacterium]|nr:squalene/phytoene synthase family protein [Alphaproteobacteria bacterium]
MNNKLNIRAQPKRENFLVGSLLLSPVMRPPIHAFYALARFGDDVADSADLEQTEKLIILAAMAGGMAGENAPGGDDLTRHAYDLGKNFAVASAKIGISTRDGENMLMAFRRDVLGEIFQDAAQLLDYCRYSAMTVGRYILRLHGLNPSQHRAAYMAADQLCAALQWLNHIQDCGADYRELGRVYLPQNLLTQHQAQESDLGRDTLTPALRAALRDWLAAGEKLLAVGITLPQHCPQKRLRAEAAAIVCLAQALAARIRHSLDHGDLLAERPELRRWDYVCAVVVGMWRGLCPIAADRE